MTIDGFGQKGGEREKAGIWGEYMSAVGNTLEAGYYVIPHIRPLNSSIEVN